MNEQTTSDPVCFAVCNWKTSILKFSADRKWKDYTDSYTREKLERLIFFRFLLKLICSYLESISVIS